MLELLVVIIIVGILAALAFPNFYRARESALEKEAQTNLRLISAAEKILYMETNLYLTGTSDLDTINTTLKVSIPAAQNWNYKIDAGNDGTGFLAKAQRVNNAAVVWCITQATDAPYDADAGCSWDDVVIR